MSDVEGQIRGHAVEVARRYTPVSGAAIRAAAVEPPSTDLRSRAARRPSHRQRRLLLVLAAALALVLATGVVIARRHQAAVTAAPSDPGTGEVLRVLPAEGTQHVEVLGSTSDYGELFNGAGRQQYVIAVSAPRGGGWNDWFFASLRSGSPTQDVEVNGAPAVQQLCNETGQKTINGASVGPPTTTGRMTVYWQINGQIVSLGIQSMGANSDCAPDGTTAKAIIAAADAVQVITQERWDHLISTAAGEACPGYEPSFPTGVLIVC